MPIPSGFVANQSGLYTRSDGAAPFCYDGTNMVFQGVGPVATYSSGNVANAAAVATIPAAVGKTGYLAGFEVTGAGATAAGVVTVTVTGLLGGTASFTLAVPAGATTGLVPLDVIFTPPLVASAANTAIVVTCPALGAGNTNATVVAHGFSI